jgi:glycine/D-amino acid oxidase-like deaminating enzyme
VIIGAGVIGASIAYHLSLRGIDVTVLEAVSPAAGASGASDGAISVITKSPGPLMQLGVHGKAYYNELACPGGILQGAFHQRSAFIAASCESEIKVIEKQAAALEQVGIFCNMLEGSALHKVFPQLSNDVPMVMEVGNEGYAIGYEIVDRFLRASGAKVRRNCPVVSIEYDLDSGRCTGVRTADHVIHADDVVLAAGLSSAHLEPRIEMLPQRGQLIVADRSDSFRHFPGHLFFASYLASKGNAAADGSFQQHSRRNGALVIDPLRTGQLLIGSTREPGDDASYADFESIQRILKTAVSYLPKIAEIDVLRVFAGVRAVMIDGTPLLGPIGAAPGLWVATGFAGDGISLAPLVGRELGKLMTGETALNEIEVMSPSRIARLRPH